MNGVFSEWICNQQVLAYGDVDVPMPHLHQLGDGVDREFQRTQIPIEGTHEPIVEVGKRDVLTEGDEVMKAVAMVGLCAVGNIACLLLAVV